MSAIVIEFPVKKDDQDVEWTAEVVSVPWHLTRISNLVFERCGDNSIETTRLSCLRTVIKAYKGVTAREINPGVISD